MKTVKMDHVGIAVKDIEVTRVVYETLGLSVQHAEDHPEIKTKVHFIPVGDTAIELLEATGPESTVAKFIESRGEGIHHIALQVSNVEEAIKDCVAHGMRMIDSQPRPGAHGSRVAFIHPKSTAGTLIELVER